MTAMKPLLAETVAPQSVSFSPGPRDAMAARIPRFLQPFLTWLTARPAAQEEPVLRPASAFVAGALAWAIIGCVVTLIPMLAPGLPLAVWLFVPFGLLATCCGLGLFQVVVFHHCSHGTVFATRERNRQVGRLISALLLFKRFDDYQREHMLHHSPKKLLTEEDEFADFVLGMCDLTPGASKRELWRKTLLNLASPVFHLRFLRRRIGASLFSGDRAHDLLGRGAWGIALLICGVTGTLAEFTLAWVLPVTLLLQVATVLRILCEHRFPTPKLIASRDRDFVSHATVGVFAGAAPPARSAATLAGALAWTGWWAEMLTVHIFTRVFVLVGDAPCHDFHHRKPATRRWTNYIHARQQDLEAGSPGYPAGYNESWGLFNAIDQNLATLAATPPASIRRGIFGPPTRGEASSGSAIS